MIYSFLLYSTLLLYRLTLNLSFINQQGFTGMYAKMTDSMESKNVFYACVVPFLIFFSLFAGAIYPARALIHPHALVDSLAAFLPANFGAPLSIIRNWSFALFYVMAEMWGSVVASLLFWGLANEVTTVDEAKKYCKLKTCSWNAVHSRLIAYRSS